MNRPRRHRYRAAGALSLAIAMGLLVAVGALAGIAVAKDGATAWRSITATIIAITIISPAGRSSPLTLKPAD